MGWNQVWGKLDKNIHINQKNGVPGGFRFESMAKTKSKQVPWFVQHFTISLEIAIERIK